MVLDLAVGFFSGAELSLNSPNPCRAASPIWCGFLLDNSHYRRSSATPNPRLSVSRPSGFAFPRFVNASRLHWFYRGRIVVMSTAEPRELFAQQVKTAANIQSESLVRALATVPREEFVGAGPWRILARPAPGQMQPIISDVSDPIELYADVAVYLDQSRTLTNGNPSTLAPWLDALGLAEGKVRFPPWLWHWLLHSRHG